MTLVEQHDSFHVERVEDGEKASMRTQNGRGVTAVVNLGAAAGFDVLANTITP